MDVHRFFDNFGWFSARFFHRFSMMELGWERVPYSTGWEGAVANLGGNTSHPSLPSHLPTQLLEDVFPPKFAGTPSHPTFGSLYPGTVAGLARRAVGYAK